jgi:hypothetical protein
MASNQSLFMRILRAIIHRVWTVLFFLTLLSVLALTNHWWDILASGCSALADWVMSAMGLIRS